MSFENGYVGQWENGLVQGLGQIFLDQREAAAVARAESEKIRLYQKMIADQQETIALLKADRDSARSTLNAVQRQRDSLLIDHTAFVKTANETLPNTNLLAEFKSVLDVNRKNLKTEFSAVGLQEFRAKNGIPTPK